MDITSTLRSVKNIFLFLAGIITLTLFNSESYAQTKNYATVSPSTGAIAYYTLLGAANQQNSANAGSVTNPGNASTAPPTAPAVLRANYFNLLGLANAEGEAYIQLKYGAAVTAGKTTYIPFDQPTITGVNLDLLSLVGDLTGLFSRQLVQLDAYSGATAGSDGTLVPAANVSSSIVKDAAGQTYFAVTSTAPYNSVRVRLRYRGNLLGLSLLTAINMNVYTAFNYTDDNCGTSVFTNIGEVTGLNVSLTSSVLNPERAIDNNLTTFSQLQAGLVGLGSTVSQTFYLNGLSSAGDVAKVVVSQPGTVLSVNVLRTITLQAYNGTTLVGTAQSAANLLNLQLLTSVGSNTLIPLYYTPGAPFDRIKISTDNTLAVGGNILSGGLNVHEVQRTVTKPVFAGIVGGALSICGGGTLALTAQSPNPAYTYNFYKKSGNVTTQVAAATASTYTETSLAAGTYTYYIAAQKAGCLGESDRDSVIVTVRPSLIFAASTLANGSVGRAYSRQVTPATGGTPGYTYALAAGSTLPAGVTISPAGLISGSPTTAGVYNFSLTVTDSFGCVTTTANTLTITPALTMPTATLPVGTVGVAYPATNLPAPTGGSTPYTYTSANIPAGLALNATTGQITGTPTQSGTFTFPVTVTDADGNTIATNFTIIVRDPLVLTPATLSPGTTGVPYPAQIIPPATGGNGVFTYTASGLPPGLSFNPATREITGTPTQAGTYTVAVNVSDGEGRTATANYGIIIKDPLLLAAGTLPDGTVNVVYPSQTIPAASGGTPGYTYEATNLPPGISFNATTRVVSGTPTQSGNFTISVKVTDNGGATLTVPYSLKVNGVLNLPTATLPDGLVGTSYTAPALPAVTGATGTVTYSVGPLPTGLTFDPATRVISGTPTVGGAFIVKMTATDSAGPVTSSDYPLNITVATPVIAGATICGGNTVTLAPTTINGVTYNFYAATGNTALGSGATYTTGALTETTTFYVEGVSGTAVSPRAAVTITVNPAPQPPTVLSNNETVSSGQTATLQASAAAGTTIRWYAAATGGSPIATGNTFTTPALTATTTYYAGSESSAGCSSLSRTPVTVNVTTGPVNPNCNSATSQQSSITGLLCVACSIANPGNSVDANLENFTRIAIPVGVGASGFQRLIFQRSGVATDSVRVDLATPGGLLDLSLLGGITINVMNGNTVVRSYALNNNLVTLGLLSGNRFMATVAAGAVYDRVEVRLNPVVSALTSVDIYGAEVIYPNPTFTAGNQTICSGSTATLTAVPQGGTTIAWFATARDTNVLSSQNTFTTPPLTATTTYYVQVSNATTGCINPVRVPVVVTVTPAVATPVLAAVAAICSGSTAVISVDSPQTGVTYNWYSLETGGTPVFTGPVFTTPALTANTSYFVEAANGTCISATRTRADVVVNGRPVLPQVQASATTVSQGQTVTLTASSADANVTFNWYTSAGSTTPVFTGATYVTPPIQATTTYYVEATNATGCASPSRAQITITVNGTGTPVPVLCESPVSQTSSAVGTIAVIPAVYNPTLAIDGDQQTASTLSIPGGINASVFQKVNFTGLSNVGDTLRIRLTSNNQLLSLSVLSNIILTTYQGTTSNNDGTALNNSLINLQLLNGGAEALINLVPTAQFDAAEVRLNSGLLGALSSVNFNYARRIVAAPTVAADTVTACLNATTTLAVSNPQPGIVYKWYDAAGTYLGNDGATFVTPAITAATTFFVEASRGGCGGSRTAVNVILTPAANVPVLLSANEQTCQNSNLVLQVQNPQAGVTYQWYNGNTAIPGATGASYSITNIQADASYSVEAINSCGVASARATVAITVGSLAAPTLIPLAVTVNSGEQTILTANSSTSNLTYTWYSSNPALPGAVVVSTPDNGANGTFITPNLVSTATFFVTAQNNTVGGCTSAAASVRVTVNPIPSNPGTVPCEAAVSQSVRQGGTLSVLATVSNPQLAVDDDATTSSSLIIPVGLNSFIAQKLNFNGLSQLGDTVTVSFSAATGGLSLAAGQSITVTSYNGATSNGDETAVSSSTLNLTIGGGGQTGTIRFVPTSVFTSVEVKLNSGLLGALTTLNINYTQRTIVAPTVVSANVAACQGISSTLAVANPQAGVTYSWYNTDGFLVNSATYETPATLAPGIYNYYVVANRNGCPSARTNVTVTVTATAPAPVASTGNPANTCPNTPVTLSVDQVAGVSYNWYDAATAGNLLAANTSTFTTPANLPAGTTTYYVEAVNGNSCVSTAARTPITITINPAATAADISITGAESSVCAGSTATLTAGSATVTNPVFTWYTDAALTNAVFTGPTFSIAGLTATTTYYVTVRGDNKCDNTSGSGRPVTVTVNPSAQAADINISGIPASICPGSSVTLTASSTTVSNPVFTWYSDAALTNVLFTGPVYNATVASGNTNFYVTVTGTNRCQNAAADARVITLTANPSATAADVSVSNVPANTCYGSGASLEASSSTVINPVFTWYTDAALTNAVFTGAVYNTPGLTSTTTYYVTVRGLNKCENIAGDATVVVVSVNNQLIFTGGALPDGTVNAAYSNQINPATGGTAGYTYTVAAGTNLPAGLSLSPSGLITGTPTIAGNYSFMVTATDNLGCNSTVTFTLNVSAAPGGMNLPPATLPDGIVDAGYTPITLPEAVGGASPYTYLVTGGTLPPGLTYNPVTREVSGTPTQGGTFTFTVTATDGAGLTASTNYTINVTVPAPTANAAESCSGTAVVLTVTNPSPNVTYNWYASASGGSILFTGTSYQTPPITANTIYYVEGVSGTARSSRTPVNVTLRQTAVAADIDIAGLPTALCNGTSTTLSASSTTVTNPVFTWYTDAALTNAVFTGADYQIPALTANTTYYVTVRGDNKCDNTSATARVVNVTVNPAIVYTGTTLNDAQVPNNYGAVLGTASGGTPAYTYVLATGSTLPPGMSLATTGVLSGTPTTAGNYTFGVTVVDSRGCNATATFTVTVNGVAMALPPKTLHDGEVGTPYTPVETLPAVTGGTGPFTYTASNLPPGLTFDPVTRQITGTPTLGGTYTINVTVTDANGQSVSGTYMISVTVPAPVANSQESCASNTVTLAVENPVTGVTYSWYAASSGGTALAVGPTYQTTAVTTTTYYVEGTSGTAKSTRTPVTINLRPTAVSADIIVTQAPPVVCANSGVTLTASSTTVTNPIFTWYTDAALTKPVFTGNVYAIPTVPASISYYVTVSGDNKCENTSATARIVTLNVNPAVVFNGGTLAEGQLTVAYSAQLNPATGGTPGYTYTVSGGALPAGLSLSSDGILSGTPQQRGNYSFDITAQDSQGCSATANFSLSIANSPNTSPMVLPPAILPDGIVGTPYSPQTLPAVTGGTGPFIYVATNLPPGLTFDPITREITGTPTVGDRFVITVSVTDANGQTVAGDYVLLVTIPAPIVSPVQICSGNAATLTVSNPIDGVTYRWYAAATGGSPLFEGRSFTTMALSANTTFFAEAVTGNTTSSRAAVEVTVLPTLASPVVSKQSSTFTSITFTWNDVPGATSYEVSTDGGSTWSNPGSGSTGTTHLVAGLQANESVTIMVRALGLTVCQTSAPGTFTTKANNGSGGGDNPAGNEVFVPNTFTPNGDGNNDIFFAYGNSITNVKMRIYDQWGHIIFQSLQKDNGWDGTYRGQLQPNGVYVYMMDVLLQDGTTVMKKGTVTLLR